MEHQPYSYANEHAPYEQFPPFTAKQKVEIENIAGEGKSDVSSVNGKTGAITGVLFQEVATILASSLKNAEITTTQIKAEGIETGSIKLEAITAALLKGEAVTAEKLATEAVTAAKIATGAVTEPKLGAEAVSTGKIKLLAVTAGTMANEAVIKEKIASGAVTASKIGTEAIETGKIQLLAVTGATIAKETITGEKLVNATIGGKQLKIGTPEALKELKENVEIETSATEVTSVSLSILFKAEETVGEIIVDGVSTFKIRKETLAASSDNAWFSFSMKAGAKFQVKMVTGKIETETTNKSVYSFQTGG